MRSLLVVLMCACAAVAVADEPVAPAAAVVATKGKMLIGADGSRLGSVSRLSADGSPQIILDGKLITVPATTLSMADGKLKTSLSKSEVLKLP